MVKPKIKSLFLGLYFLYLPFCAVNAQDGLSVGRFVLTGKNNGKDTGRKKITLSSGDKSTFH
jgi:hypothetical protein